MVMKPIVCVRVCVWTLDVIITVSKQQGYVGSEQRQNSTSIV